MVLEQSECFLSLQCRDDAVSLALKPLLQNLDGVFVIVHEEYQWAHGILLLRFSAPPPPSRHGRVLKKKSRVVDIAVYRPDTAVLRPAVRPTAHHHILCNTCELLLTSTAAGLCLVRLTS